LLKSVDSELLCLVIRSLELSRLVIRSLELLCLATRSLVLSRLVIQSFTGDFIAGKQDAVSLQTPVVTI
jgi:hypothetical protein